MPYIIIMYRELVDHEIHDLAMRMKEISETYAESLSDLLLYVIIELVDNLYKKSYTDLNAAIGVLQCVQRELHRRNYQNRVRYCFWSDQEDYINDLIGELIDQEVSDLLDRFSDNKVLMEKRDGVLNYIITRLLVYLYKENGKFSDEPLLVMQIIERNIYSKFLAKYEDDKCKENGDVYDA